MGRKGSGTGIGLEELAKIRYAYLYDPATVHRAAKSLWTLAEDEGCYERAFGVGGHLHDVWSQEDLAETCYAIALHLRITRQAKMLGDKDKNLTFMYRLRFHILALAASYTRHHDITGERLGGLLDSKEAFETQFTRFWRMASPLLIYRVQEVIDNGTLFDFLRSQERWAQLRKTFAMNLAAVA